MTMINCVLKIQHAKQQYFGYECVMKSDSGFPLQLWMNDYRYDSQEGPSEDIHGGSYI